MGTNITLLDNMLESVRWPNTPCSDVGHTSHGLGIKLARHVKRQQVFAFRVFFKVILGSVDSFDALACVGHAVSGIIIKMR